MRFSRLGAWAAALALAPELSLAQSVGIPTTPFEQTNDEVLKLDSIKCIIVDSKYAESTNDKGLTLIPPTLIEFATTFAEDLGSSLDLKVSVEEGDAAADGAIFLTLDEGNECDYKDAAGRNTAEGYTLETSASGIVIKGASPLGAWWGTRTVLQQGALSKGASVPVGSATDAPGWDTRGMMLDAARRFYSQSFIIDICSYMSFFKQNTLHLHLTDEQIVKPYTMDTYSAFRFRSESEAVAGLASPANESFSREQFDDIQTKCAARGVTILPEIEAPGHALAIVKWRPQIAYEGNPSLLNLTHPDTLPTMKTIWTEFLPWFQSKVVSIGADEYFGPPDQYRDFVNALSTFITDKSGKSVRIWGTFPEQEINKDVSIQHWSNQFDSPLADYVEKGYSVLNSYDTFYIVLKFGAYGRKINLETTFSGNPDGGAWYPHIFDTKISSLNAARDEPLIQGSIIPLWADHGPTVGVDSEAYYAWKDGIPALADKHWGGELTADQFADAFPKLHPYIPGQDLERTVDSDGTTIFDYDLKKEPAEAVKDQSPNAYDAETTCESSGSSSLKITPDCSFKTPLSSKGRNYTLSLSLKVDSIDEKAGTTLITGRDSSLMLTPNITFFSAGIQWALDVTIPLREWVELDIIARGDQTFASFTSESGKTADEEEFTTSGEMFDGYPSFYPMAFEAPIEEVSGWTGELRALSLTSEA